MGSIICPLQVNYCSAAMTVPPNVVSNKKPHAADTAASFITRPLLRGTSNLAILLDTMSILGRRSRRLS
jgi:hypothetical protein